MRRDFRPVFRQFHDAPVRDHPQYIDRPVFRRRKAFLPNTPAAVITFG